MKQTIAINFYVDPGHGWFKVKRDVLSKLRIADKISHYSFERGEFVYLEEDCDAGYLFKALKEHGIEPKVKQHVAMYKQSRIRNYNRYKVAA